jgi:hypothetical protein
MAKIWLTYAWTDNTDKDVDFVAQELESSNLEVRLDRWNLSAGKRLWEQIEQFIQNRDECDAWVIYATQNSLGSEACREEYAYALDRALHTRGAAFPVIGLFPSTVDSSLIPAGIRTRLFISTMDADWKERIKASAENRTPDISKPVIEPYFLNIHELKEGFAIEMRPRAGSWAPFICATPANEKDKVVPRLVRQPAGGKTLGGPIRIFATGPFETISDDGEWLLHGADDEATPSQSYYLFCSKLPTTLSFGCATGPIYTVSSGNGPGVPPLRTLAISPRVIEKLEEWKGTPYVIVFTLNDNEAEDLTHSLDAVLKQAGWAKIAVLESDEELWMKISIETRGFRLGPETWTLRGPASDLSDYLDSNELDIMHVRVNHIGGWDFADEKLGSKSIPDGTVKIEIGKDFHRWYPSVQLPEVFRHFREENISRLKREWGL